MRGVDMGDGDVLIGYALWAELRARVQRMRAMVAVASEGEG